MLETGKNRWSLLHRLSGEVNVLVVQRSGEVGGDVGIPASQPGAGSHNRPQLENGRLILWWFN